MRIVEIIREYKPGDGINHAAIHMAGALRRRRGAEVELLFEQGAPPFPWARRCSFLGAVKYAASNADVVHSHVGTGVVKAGLARLLSPKVRHVTTYSVIAPPGLYPLHSRALWFHRFAYFTGVDLAVGISKYAARDFREKFGREASVIYDGVDPRRFRPDAAAGVAFRRRHGIPSGVPVVGYVSRFNPHKNHAALVRAFASLPKDAFLVLGGVGDRNSDTTAHCRKLASELGVAGRVRFLGFVPDSEMNALYNGIDVHGFPSLWEGFGLNILEASAAGTPTVAFDLYAIPELVGRHAGNGFAVGTEAEFAEKLGFLLGSGRERRRAGRAARAFARRFSWDRVAGRYLAAFKRLCE